MGAEPTPEPSCGSRKSPSADFELKWRRLGSSGFLSSLEGFGFPAVGGVSAEPRVGSGEITGTGLGPEGGGEPLTPETRIYSPAAPVSPEIFTT